MTFAVTDASVALKLFLAEAGSEESDKLRRSHDLIAPDLVLAEMLNALWKAHRRGLVGEEQANLAAASIAQPFFVLVPAEELIQRSWEIAIALDHPAYDALYIALAERERCFLFTADDRLYRKTRRTRFAKLVKPLRDPR